MTNFWQNLFKPSWWFSPPTLYSSELKIYFAISLALVILSLICYIIFTHKSRAISPHQKLKGLTFSWLLGFGLVGLLLSFFAWQTIPYLSTRSLFAILFLVVLVWFIYFLFYYKFVFRRLLEQFQAEENYKKYLPKTRKRKI